MNKIKFELNVPSGIMIFNDSLPGFNIFGYFDVNTREGLINQTIAMAQIGCAHAYVGNSCPDIYQINDKTFAIIEEDADSPKKILKKYKHVGHIITDLWWYSFVDASEYIRRNGVQKHDYGQIKVRPGVYKFLHTLPMDQNAGKLIVHTTITWIRKPDPMKDYLKEFRERDFTAEQVISHELKRWPDLYNNDKDIDNIIIFAAYLFCSWRSDYKELWHPNGFAQFDPLMPDAPAEIIIPALTKPLCWPIPIKKDCSLVKAANGEIYLNPSFADFAKKVARCIAKYVPKNNYGKRAAKNLMNRKIAAKCLRKLIARYI